MFTGSVLSNLDKKPADSLPPARRGHDQRHDSPPAPLALQVRDRRDRDDAQHLPVELGDQDAAGCLGRPQLQAPPDAICPVIGIAEFDQQRCDLRSVVRLSVADGARCLAGHQLDALPVPSIGAQIADCDP